MSRIASPATMRVSRRGARAFPAASAGAAMIAPAAPKNQMKSAGISQSQSTIACSSSADAGREEGRVAVAPGPPQAPDATAIGTAKTTRSRAIPIQPSSARTS